VLDLKKQCVDLLKIRVCPLIPLRVRSVKTIDVKPSSQSNPKITTPWRPVEPELCQPESPLTCSHLCRLALPYSVHDDVFSNTLELTLC
jgi:hypothetical protein